MESSRAYKGHVLVVPYPNQAHINPMLHFCRRLISRGIKTTLLTSICISNAMSLPSSIGSVNLDVISDGFDHGGFAHSSDIDHYFSKLISDGKRTLGELVKRYTSSGNRIDCIIYESFLSWALDVAKEHGLLAAAFFAQPCAVDWIYYSIHRNLLKLPVVVDEPVSLPGLPLLQLQDLPSFLDNNGSRLHQDCLRILLNQFSNVDKADFVLVNTFYKLEKEVVDEMSKVFAILTIGPTVTSTYLDKRIENDDDYGMDLFAADADNSIKWLSTKPKGSVIYVAFGSMINLSEKQIDELAFGLEATNFNFLWVIQGSEKSKLPKQFVENLRDKGLLVNWSPQVKILENSATGCFLTHCGWNSMVEAMSLGVPMVCMPQWTDQPTNAKFIEDVWKVGVRVKVNEKDIVTRDEIEYCLRQVVEGPKGKELKKNARKWRESALEAVSEGGTSDQNIDIFVRELISSKA